MTLAYEVKKIVESKPFCAAAGAGGYAVDRLRKVRASDVPRTARAVQDRTAEIITQDLPAKARSYADSVAERVAKAYDDLAVRGREIVSSVSGRAAHEFEDVSAGAKPRAGRAKIPGRRQEPVVTPSPVGAPVRKKQEPVVQPSPVGARVRSAAKAGTSRAGRTSTRKV
ncbi:hypothetical protein EDD27_5334 [Nonomuraea polychroma]|uniref:Uncharacterized protein n=1 Tax=Nonomuraea polychroma TaxID=46176 RepID=A0A438MAD7_9ACTN|nr:hypothetical protein [Nonomuraea polychroma]RVX42690.1 hypothetical protein EDD27_5334 [Nonomuraea polychroma]